VNRKSGAKVTSPEKRAPASREEALFTRVLDIVEAARGHVARSVNSAMVHAYWRIGREIVVAEQAGAERAGYGDEVIERLSERLTRKLGKGFGPRTLWRLRQFYQLYPSGSSVASPPILTGARTESAAPAILIGPLSQSGPGPAAGSDELKRLVGDYVVTSAVAQDLPVVFEKLPQDRISLLDSAWRLVPDVVRDDPTTGGRLKAEPAALLGSDGPSKDLLADWKKRFPPPGGRGKVKRMAPAQAAPDEGDED
jgi:hypothetical protein